VANTRITWSTYIDFGPLDGRVSEWRIPSVYEFKELALVNLQPCHLQKNRAHLSVLKESHSDCRFLFVTVIECVSPDRIPGSLGAAAAYINKCFKWYCATLFVIRYVTSSTAKKSTPIRILIPIPCQRQSNLTWQQVALTE